MKNPVKESNDDRSLKTYMTLLEDNELAINLFTCINLFWKSVKFPSSKPTQNFTFLINCPCASVFSHFFHLCPTFQLWLFQFLWTTPHLRWVNFAPTASHLRALILTGTFGYHSKLHHVINMPFFLKKSFRLGLPNSIWRNVVLYMLVPLSHTKHIKATDMISQ